MSTFSHFCPEHTVMLLVIAIAVITGLLILRRSSDNGTQRSAVILSVGLFLAEALQDIILVTEGRNIIDCLPLHLCNLGIFVNLIASLTKGRFQSFFAELSLVLIMPGSAAALLFPDWTYRPFWSAVSMLCFFTHSLLVFIPLLFLATKKVRVTFKHFWYPLLFLTVIVTPIYLLDRNAGVNYMFLMYPPESSPLEFIHNLTGDTYYIAGLIVLILLILFFEYGIYSVFFKLTRRK